MNYQLINTDALHQAAVATAGPQAASFMGALYDQLEIAEQRGYAAGQIDGAEADYDAGYQDGVASVTEPELPLQDAYYDVYRGEMKAGPAVIDMRGMLSTGVTVDPSEDQAYAAQESAYSHDMHYGH